MNLTNTKGLHCQAVKCLVFGKSGAGKTTLLGTGDNEHTLIISAESGLLALKDKSIAVAEVFTWHELQQAFKMLVHDESLQVYTTVCIDSLTELSDKLVKYLESFPEYQDPKNTFKMWGQYNTSMISLIKAFRDLKGRNIIFTALAEDIKDGDILIKAPMIAGNKAQSLLASFFDEVFYLTMDDITKERVLFTEATLSFVAKDRSGTLNKSEKPDLIHIFNKIKGIDNGENEPVRNITAVQ